MPTTPMQGKFPPGPPPVSRNPIKLLRYFMRLRKDIVGFVKGRFDAYGDTYYAPLGKTQLFATRDPAWIRAVTQTQGTQFMKPEEGNAARQLRVFLGNGLLNSNGDFWRKQRRMINPAFHKKRIEAYASMMVAYTQDQLATMRDGQVLDMSHAMMELTLRIVGKALFDRDSRNDADAVAASMTAFRAGFGIPQMLAWLPIPAVRRAKHALQAMDVLVYGMIDERRAQGAALEERLDLLSMLVQMVDEDGDGEGMERKQLRDEVLTMFLAGHETTSHALTWTLYLLSQSPDAAQRLTQELDDVLAGRAPTIDDLPSLPYTLMCLKEGMRLYPPAYVFSRTAIEETELEGYHIPKGAEVLIWLYWTHRDPRWFPEPEAFRPERFSADNEAALPKGAYIPFGAGTRSCIGKSFAMMEAHLILATLLQQFAFHLVPGHPVVPDFSLTLSPKHGMKMQLAAR